MVIGIEPNAFHVVNVREAAQVLLPVRKHRIESAEWNQKSF